MAKTTNNITKPKTLPATASSNLAAQIEKQMEADYMAGNTYGVSKTIAQKVDNTPSDYVGKGVIGTTGSASNSTGSSGQGAMETKKSNDYATRFFNGDYSFVDGVNVKAAGTNPDGSFWYDDGSGALKHVNGNYTTPNIQSATNMLNTASNNMSNKKLSDEVLATIYEYKNRPAFSYDPTADSLYQNALNSAMKGGQMAMQDTIGQASALTGGYGSSYATSAANQAYNSFIEGAYDNMADYYNMALNAYNAEGDRLLNAYNMLSDQDKFAYQKDVDAYNRAYQERRDAIADAQWQKSFDWQVATDARDYDRSVLESDRAYEYQQGRDAIEDEQWQAGFDESVREYNKDFNYQKKQDANEEEWRQREWDYGVEQDKINNDLARQKSTQIVYRNSDDDDKDNTTEESLYTATQFSNVKNGLTKAVLNGEDAADAYIEQQRYIKPFTEAEEEELYKYVYDYFHGDGADAPKSNNNEKSKDISKLKWKYVKGQLIASDGTTINATSSEIDGLVSQYGALLKRNGEGSIDEKMTLFRARLLNLIP